jgi:Zn-finger nucleic acid-binding protein
MQVTLDTTELLGEQLLQCPACRGNWLHQRGVADSLELARTQIRVTFECENCDAVSMLSIRQHKGVTIVAWDRTLEVPAWAR